MMREIKISCLLGLVFLLNWSLPVTAHYRAPEGAPCRRIYIAGEIPEAELPEIVIDGDLTDWEGMSLLGLLKLEDYPDRVTGGGKQDFDFQVQMAWSHRTNMLYIAAEVTDDSLYSLPPDRASEMHRADVLQVYIDADHSGGNYRGSQDSHQAQQIFLYCLPGGKSSILRLQGTQELSWALNRPYAYSAAHYDGHAIHYELAMTLWDWLEETPSKSKKHILKRNETIGCKLTIKDADESGQYGMGASMGYTDAWEDADNFVDLLLAP